MELNKQQLTEAISILESADGEDIQYIIEKIGMQHQLLRQLFVTETSDLVLKNLIEERDEVNSKPLWASIIDDNHQLKSVANKVWNDIFNNDTLIHGDFESYWNDFKI
jgi:hypothetical protein